MNGIIAILRRLTALHFSIWSQPSTKISEIENVEVVFKDGAGYDSAKLIASLRGLVALR